jgi:hypothetical protein
MPSVFCKETATLIILIYQFPIIPAGIHKTSYEPLTVVISARVRYHKRDKAF